MPLIIPSVQPLRPNHYPPMCNEYLNHHLGGSISTPAYALLAGVALENKSKILSIPLTSLPTTLGKEHDTKDINFVCLTEDNSSDGEKAEGGIFYK